MMNSEIIHTAIWAGRMIVLAASVLRVRLETVCNLSVTHQSSPQQSPQRVIPHQIDAIDEPDIPCNPINT